MKAFCANVHSTTRPVRPSDVAFAQAAVPSVLKAKAETGSCALKVTASGAMRPIQRLAPHGKRAPAERSALTATTPAAAWTATSGASSRPAAAEARRPVKPFVTTPVAAASSATL